MENGRPSSLREDIWPRPDRALPEENSQAATVRHRTDLPCFICFASQAGIALS